MTSATGTSAATTAASGTATTTGATTTVAVKYDPARMYKVELSRAVECPPGSGRTLTPGKNRRHHVRGDLVAGLGTALVSAKVI